MFRFPWGDMHSLNLGWFLQKFNELRADWATAEENITGALDAEIQRAEDALSDVFDARDAAAASATAAAGSASSAGTSATAAQNSATAAGNSATLANNKATAAGLSEAAAAQSAQQAGNSATAAAGSATAAGQSATNAAASETAAGQSASAAAGSATAAGNSATAAAGSASAAEASADRAEQVEQSIPADYTALSNTVDSIHLFEIELLKDDATILGFVNGQTGSVTLSEQWYCTDFVFVPAKSISVLCTLLGNGGLAFYRFNKTFISGINGNNASDYGLSPGSAAQTIALTVPEEAYYIRVCNYGSNNRLTITGVIEGTSLVEQLSNAHF